MSPLIYQEGITAYRRGIALEDNPYFPTDPDWQFWRAGWQGEQIIATKYPPTRRTLHNSDYVLPSR